MDEELTDDIDLSEDTLVDAVRHELAEQIDEDQLDFEPDSLEAIASIETTPPQDALSDSPSNG